GPFIAIGAADVRQDLAHVVRLHPGQRIGVAIGAVLNRLLELRPRALRRGLRQRHAGKRKEREQGNQGPQGILPLIWPWLSVRPSIGAGTARDRSRPPPSPIPSNLPFRYARRTSDRGHGRRKQDYGATRQAGCRTACHMTIEMARIPFRAPALQSMKNRTQKGGLF